MIELKVITVKKMESVDCTFITHTRKMCSFVRKPTLLTNMSNGRDSKKRLEPVMYRSTNKHHAESIIPALIKTFGCTAKTVKVGTVN